MNNYQKYNNGKVVSFLNMKGGVGKTTLCVSLAYQLSVEFNKKILILDMDPQFNATQTIMEQYNLIDEYLNNYRINKRTIMEVFNRNDSLVTTIEEKEILPEDLIISSKVNENLDIICGTLDLIRLEKSQDSIMKKRLKIFIDKHGLKSEYDYIFIDCPPTISFYTDAALLASDSYIIPVKVDKFSTLGVKLLDKVIKKYKEDPDFKLECAGIVYMMQENQSKLDEIKRTFEENDLISHYNVFKNSLRKHNHLLSGEQGNIAFNYQVTRKDLNEIAKEFLGVFEGSGICG
ncbi:ParA family protein [Siminovitchia terrae]|uniref:ParA family protein n=1 Tax=Siminovitchia terrae TaxID=1914933 RepID=A0A429X5E1_SIMTE|nr:AAA family ATPase [Siminovitchia terrae]RST58589.1 ParA family protein [Siminovitchia terrae]